MHPRLAIAALLIVLVSCTTSRTTIAPGTSGTIDGIVTYGGAVLPGATVTITDASGRPRSAVTDAEGRYRIEALPPGTYDILVELTGLTNARRRVTITADRGASLATQMRATVSEAITVTAESAGAWGGALGALETPEPLPSTGIAVQSIPPIVPEIPRVTGPSHNSWERSTDAAHAQFIDTKSAPATTFAIDVDRASYTNVRRLITEHSRPVPEAVRIEEMLNYFRWSYPQPEGDAAFSVTTEVAGCPWNAEHRLVRIGIQGRQLDRWKMAPNNLVFLLDTSASMQAQDRLPFLQSAMHVLVEQLRAEDRVSIVTYSGDAGLVLDATSAADKSTIFAAIDTLKPHGDTAGAAGIDLAYAIAKRHFIAGGNNRIILGTDGDFNVGPHSVEELEQLVANERQSNIDLSVVGVGVAANDQLMETLADKGNGNYAYLDTAREAERVFRDELTGTLVTIAKDVKVQIEFDPALVASYRQIGYENRALENKDFANDAKDAGELGAGHSVTALFEIVPAARATGRIATLRLRYKAPDSDVSTPIETTIVDEGRSAYEASPDMQFAAAIAQFAMLLRDGADRTNASWDDVLQLARVARGADLDGTREEFLRLVESARSLNP